MEWGEKCKNGTQRSRMNRVQQNEAESAAQERYKIQNTTHLHYKHLRAPVRKGAVARAQRN